MTDLSVQKPEAPVNLEEAPLFLNGREVKEWSAIKCSDVICILQIHL